MGLFVTQVFLHITLDLTYHIRDKTCSHSRVIKATDRPEKLHQHFVLNNCSRKAELKTLGKLSVANISLHVGIIFFLFQSNIQRLQKMSSRPQRESNSSFFADAAATAVC